MRCGILQQVTRQQQVTRRRVLDLESRRCAFDPAARAVIAAGLVAGSVGLPPGSHARWPASLGAAADWQSAGPRE